MDKRYQVFVSSTYEDLKEERREVMQALLEMNCIPYGMELFPASNDDQWTFIERVIDDCDYYILILGGRYGSRDPVGMGYTEKEYRYAVKTGKPVAAFVVLDTQKLIGEKIENTDEGKKKLRDFREFVEQKLIRYWTNKDDLAGAVSRSMNLLIRQYPTVGWVKADKAVDDKSLKEILRLKNENDELRNKISEIEINAPIGSDKLASGEDEVKITIALEVTRGREELNLSIVLELTWNKVFSAISPILSTESTEEEMEQALIYYIFSQYKSEVLEYIELQNKSKFKNAHIYPLEFQRIKIQLKALGLIKQSVKSRSVKDNGNYWTLTPYGDTIMTQLLAIKKSEEPEWVLGDDGRLVNAVQTL